MREYTKWGYMMTSKSKKEFIPKYDGEYSVLDIEHKFWVDMFEFELKIVEDKIKFKKELLVELEKEFHSLNKIKGIKAHRKRLMFSINSRLII